MSTASGVVSTSCRPLGGTRHSRILASSPAVGCTGSSLLAQGPQTSPDPIWGPRTLPQAQPSLLTHGEAVGVKGVPGQISHGHPILQSGQCSVGQTAGLPQLWEVPPPRGPSVTGKRARSQWLQGKRHAWASPSAADDPPGVMPKLSAQSPCALSPVPTMRPVGSEGGGWGGGKSSGSGLRGPGFDSQLHTYTACDPTGHLASLCLTTLICKTGIRVAPPARGTGRGAWHMV